MRPASIRPRATGSAGGPRRLLRAAFAAALLAAGLGPAADALAQPGGDLPEQLQTIASVRFKGMRHLSRRDLSVANLKTRQPSRLPWKERPGLRLDYLRADTAAIVATYRHYGYLDARARWELQPTHDPHAVRVVFIVDEGPRSQVSRVTLEGVTVFHEREILRQLLARPRRPYDPAFLPLDTLKISALYGERGFRPHTEPSARRDVPDSLGVSVRYAVTEGVQYRIGTIDYVDEGRNVRPSLGRRELLVRPGDVYKRSRVEQSIERLYGTGLFTQVQVSPVPDTAAGRMDLVWRVSERKPRWIDAGVGAGTTDRFHVTAEWGHRNLDTRALAGVVDGELAYDGQARFTRGVVSGTLTEPWLLGIRLLGQVRPFYAHTVDYTNESQSIQRLESRGIEFGLQREFSRIFRATVANRNELDDQQYQLGDSLRASLTQHQIDSLAATIVPRYRKNLITLTLQRDTRDDRIAPARGSLQTLIGELAGGPLKGQSSYRKTQFSTTWYSPMRESWTLATRVMGGVMGPIGNVPPTFSPDAADSEVARVPRESRFFTGGVNSLRGWGENSIPQDGGLALLLANVELRMPLAGPFGIEAFVDAGNVWPRPEYIHLADFVAPWRATRANPGDVRYTYGVGGRLVLPFGPLRVDLAWSSRPDFPRARAFNRRLPFAYQFAIGPTY